jgi:hypothetical protein
VLAFDGSEGGRYGVDSTALIGVTVEQVPHLFVVGCWERPPGATEWPVDRDDVNQTVAGAHQRWNVRERVCDKSRGVTEMNAWADEYGSPPVVEFPHTRPGMAQASAAFRNAANQGKLSHDGDPRLARHLGNAIAQPHGLAGYFIQKDPSNRGGRSTSQPPPS